jgi:prepilin-type N-terminal cleavage/methylation domain-containing protein/prepilin-type processing-associated H-X9-DG protein
MTPEPISWEWVAMRTRRGFTLIELLVVIAVIAILMGILMPALMMAKNVGKRILCSNNLRIMSMANVLYADQSDGWYVPIMDRRGNVNRYWPDNQLFRKLMGYKMKEGATPSNDYTAPKQFLCPSDVISKQQTADSQYNNWLSYAGNITDWYFGDWYGIYYAGFRNTFVRNAAGKLAFSESNDWWFWWKGANYFKGWDVLHQDTIMPYKDAGCDGPTLYRHAEGVNLSFYDGHVEYRKKQKVWVQEDWESFRPGMWSIFGYYPPTKAQRDSIPHP